MSVADVCDLAYATWLEQLEGDARAAQGYTEDSVADVRQRLNVHLYGEPAPDLNIPADELALRRSLGVA